MKLYFNYQNIQYFEVKTCTRQNSADSVPQNGEQRIHPRFADCINLMSWKDLCTLVIPVYGVPLLDHHDAEDF